MKILLLKIDLIIKKNVKINRKKNIRELSRDVIKK